MMIKTGIIVLAIGLVVAVIGFVLTVIARSQEDFNKLDKNSPASIGGGMN